MNRKRFHLKTAANYMLPFMQVGQVDLPISVNMLPCFDHHGAGGLDETDGRIVRIAVQQPQAYGDVVHIS